MGTIYRNGIPYGSSIESKITKISQLENDVGYITEENIEPLQEQTNLIDSKLNTEKNDRINSDNLLQNDIDNIKLLIPNQASSTNKLTDEDFVNSSIATNTSNFIGTFNTLEELESQIATNNDYAFWKTTDELGAILFKRYKYVSDDSSWQFEYDLNNSSFTEEQWKAINSGITDELVEEFKNIKSSSLSITQEDYDNLTEEEKNNGTVYYITDAEGSAPRIINDEIVTEDTTWSSEKIDTTLNGALTELLSIKDYTTSNENGYHIVSIIFDKVYTKPPVISFSLIDFTPYTELDYNYWGGIVSVPKIFNVDKNGFKFAYIIRDNHPFTFRFSIIGV